MHCTYFVVETESPYIIRMSFGFKRLNQFKMTIHEGNHYLAHTQGLKYLQLVKYTVHICSFYVCTFWQLYFLLYS